MATDQSLLAALHVVERSGSDAFVRFLDGEAYVVRVISTMHAEAGDDVVAEVVQADSVLTGGTIPTGGFMNFQLADVAEVVVAGERVFGYPFSSKSSSHESSS